MAKKTKKFQLAHRTHKQPSYPRLMAWVKLTEEVEKLDKQYKYTETMGEGPYIYFGEIPNMPGHCVIMNRNSKFTIGMHTENFRELTEDEI
jgi:hypothetical protein